MTFGDTIPRQKEILSSRMENHKGETQALEDAEEFLCSQIDDIECDTQALDEHKDPLRTQLVINEGETQVLNDNEDQIQTQFLESDEDLVETPSTNIEDETQRVDDHEDFFQTQLTNIDEETQLLDDNEDLLETQLVNIEDGTQPLDDNEDLIQTQRVSGETDTQLWDDPEDSFETQLVNLAGETQSQDENDYLQSQCTNLLDDDNDDGQVVYDSDDEVTNETEILSETKVLSPVSSVKIFCFRSINEKNLQCDSFCELEQGPVQGAPNLKEHTPDVKQADKGTMKEMSGSAQITFTSVLAAQHKASNGTISGLSTITNQSTSSEKPGDENDGKSGLILATEIGEKGYPDLSGNRNMKERSNRSNGRKGSSAVRKLFTDDVTTDKKCLSDHVIDDEILDPPQLPPHDENLAGLSYVDSQEPGDLSQACALDFVDNFLKDNVFNFNQVNYGELLNEESNPLIGPQKLAKKANSRAITERAGVFDWDNNHEDEGGGDFYCRMKGQFFKSKDHRRRSLPTGQKVKGCKIDNLQGKGNCSNVHSEKKNLADSDPKLFHFSKETHETSAAAEPKTKRNLASKINEQLNRNVSVGHVSVVSHGKQSQDILCVGPDTQAAAEAMEALVNGDCCGDSDANAAYNHNQKFVKGTRGRVSSDLPHYLKRAHLTSGVITRLSKRTKRIGAKPSEILDSQPVNARGSCEKVCKEKLPTLNKDSKLMQDEGSIAHVSLKRGREQTDSNSCVNVLPVKIIALSYPKGKRMRRNSAAQVTKSGTAHRSPEQSEKVGISRRVSSRRRLDTESTTLTMSGRTTRRCSSEFAFPDLSHSGRDVLDSNPDNLNGKIISGDFTGIEATKQSVRNNKTNQSAPPKCGSANVRSDVSPNEGSKPSTSSCITPLSRVKSSTAPSPICIGDEYFQQTCKKFLRSELKGLVASAPKPKYAFRDSTRRRDMTDVRVLFSRHLDEETIKQQMKIVERLGASVASYISDASHFITDIFVRTRNMLEAIASGKPVVTHLWLESCNQTNCVIDEKNYILRDAKKEKEFGFSMPASLAHACQQPLLQNRRVLITSNTQPGKEIIASLVKAVHGQPIERIGRASLKDDKIPDDLLILSSEEDYTICEPLLEEGASIYSSELLLNGIVTQRLDYERHRIFQDRVKKTRSTLRMRKGGNQFLPVTKC